MRRPASAKMRRSTDGMVTMVGPMSKRKPAPSSCGGLAAEPFVALEEDDFVAARGERAGGGESAESAADDADAFHGRVFLDLALSISALSSLRIAAKRLRPCAARM